MARSKTEFVGVIGLGNMGGGIARNLISAGHHVLVWDIADEAMNKFSRKATLSEPKEMVARCSIIFFVVKIDDIVAVTIAIKLIPLSIIITARNLPKSVLGVKSP